MSEKDTDGTGKPSDGQMAAKIILLVSDSNDPTLGAEINIQVTYRPLVVLASGLADSAEESDHRLDDQADPGVDEGGAGGWQPGLVDSLNGNGRRQSGVRISSLLFWKRARRPSG